MMRLQNQAAKEKLIVALDQVHSQVQVIESLLRDERDCQEILQEFSAARSTAQDANRAFLQEYANTCLLDWSKAAPGENHAVLQQKRKKNLQDLIALIEKSK
jgi:DNA-binding FrmR family transcriptional regulator